MRMKRKAPKAQPSPDQASAVLGFAEEHGRNWKSALSTCWMRASYEGREDGHLLQQVRNQLGPSWLIRVTLAELEKIAGEDTPQ